MAVKRFSLMVALAASLVLFVACGGGGGSGGGGDDGGGTPPPPPPPLPEVTLSANPETIAAGESSTLTWTVKNATSCTGSDGLSGSISPKDGSLSVTPTETTTYSLECYNSVKASSGAVSTAVKVRLQYADKVVAIVPMHNSLAFVNRRVPGGYVEVINKTSTSFYNIGLRKTGPRADCLVEMSAISGERGDSTILHLLLNPKTREVTMDDSEAGQKLDRAKDFIYSVPWDPNYPDLSDRAPVADGEYQVLSYESWNIYFQPKGGGNRIPVVQTTYEKDGSVNYMTTYSCTEQ